MLTESPGGPGTPAGPGVVPGAPCGVVGGEEKLKSHMCELYCTCADVLLARWHQVLQEGRVHHCHPGENGKIQHLTSHDPTVDIT